MQTIQEAISQIKTEFDKKIVKQDEAKNALSYALAMHFFKAETRDAQGINIKKSNTLLMGSTGVGKTLMASQIEAMGFDVFKLSGKDITDEGISGMGVSDFLKIFLKECNNDVSRLEKAVIFIDEFDKICGSYRLKNGGDHNKATQQLLLKFVEGHNYYVNGQKVNSDNMMFVLCGNFQEIRDKRKAAKEGETKPSMGFTGTQQPKFEQQPLHVELQEAGLMAELAGRISLVAELHDLTRDDLFEILDGIENGILDQYAAVFANNDEALPIIESDMETIVDSCIANKTGARGLQTELDKLLYKRLTNG